MVHPSNDHIAGQGCEYTIGDTVYKLKPLKMGHLLGEATAILRQKGIDAVQASHNSNPGAKRDIVARVALRPISHDAVVEWLATYEGILWMVAKSSGVSQNKLQDLEIDDLDDLSSVVARISGIGGEPADGDEDNKDRPTTATSGTNA